MNGALYIKVGENYPYNIVGKNRKRNGKIYQVVYR
jgi:hypothetical protein